VQPAVRKALGREDIWGVGLPMSVAATSDTDVETLIGAEPTPARILELLVSLRLPSVSDEEDFAREGGLLSLGVDDLVVARGAADYIDRILKGVKVAELPVVLPSKFTLGVNLKTAEALGLTISPAILLRADEVIE
jgi:putative ABC transport system substrate-binding protein